VAKRKNDFDDFLREVEEESRPPEKNASTGIQQSEISRIDRGQGESNLQHARGACACSKP